MPKQKPHLAAIYCRVSSKANKDSASVGRQKKACQDVCSKMQWKVVKNVAEVVSGSLPKDQRQTFCSLLQTCAKRGIKNLVVEGARTIARSAKTCEEFYEMSKNSGIKITAADIPTLYEDSEGNAAKAFLRHVLFGYVQLERDMLVHRLQDGLKKKRHEAEVAARKGVSGLARSQHGKVKINGRRSIFENKKWSKKKIQSQLGNIFRQYAKGKISLRLMASEISAKMKLQNKIAHETARRMFQAWGR
ncbi:unnamed protein product [Symbiodinium necroappetens]|uniref:Resolvase/invertase-type recombinase catalytic domain-containing protein n=1 Tax=Symbiodinium necroappetens TaxID=1628268 RepID=A0A812X6Z7_9DINO|nr:unnamed protein product [Symbiodinium necroappetens]